MLIFVTELKEIGWIKWDLQKEKLKEKQHK